MTGPVVLAAAGEAPWANDIEANAAADPRRVKAMRAEKTRDCWTIEELLPV